MEKVNALIKEMRKEIKTPAQAKRAIEVLEILEKKLDDIWWKTGSSEYFDASIDVREEIHLLHGYIMDQEHKSHRREIERSNRRSSSSYNMAMHQHQQFMDQVNLNNMAADSAMHQHQQFMNQVHMNNHQQFMNQMNMTMGF